MSSDMMMMMFGRSAEKRLPNPTVIKVAILKKQFLIAGGVGPVFRAVNKIPRQRRECMANFCTGGVAPFGRHVPEWRALIWRFQSATPPGPSPQASGGLSLIVCRFTKRRDFCALTPTVAEDPALKAWPFVRKRLGMDKKKPAPNSSGRVVRLGWNPGLSSSGDASSGESLSWQPAAPGCPARESQRNWWFRRPRTGEPETWCRSHR